MFARRFVFLILASGACGGGGPKEGIVEVRMEYSRADGFYTAPFPSDALRATDGRISLRGFPNPKQVALLGQGVTLLSRDARGFARTAGVFFALTGTADVSRLPDLAGSISSEARVFLAPLNDITKRHPIVVTFTEKATPSGAPNLLALLPLQGRPLKAQTTYVAVVLKSVNGSDGLALKASPVMNDLAGGRTPAELPAAPIHLDAMKALRAAGISSSNIAALTVFTTDDPVASFQRAAADALALPAPAAGPFTRTDTYDDYCMYQSGISMPVFQEGAPPYTTTGGRWALDADGHLVVQRRETSRVFVSVPRRAAPSAAGYPLVVMIRTGSGTDRALDRGVRDAQKNILVPGDGPAVHFARVGFAGLSFDGPHGGMRNSTGADEQFTVFNVFNPPALRDNVRQSALEVVIVAHVLGSIAFDASDCPGATAAVRFDVSVVALMGHSMGASIAPLAAAVEPKYKALILSGAGASWIANSIDKLKPFAVRPALEVLFGYGEGEQLTATDPTVTMVQWAPEGADAQVFAEHLVDAPLVGSPRHVLMIQGIVDHYIMPSIANALTLSAGLDLAGPEVDDVPAELASHPKLRDVLQFSGRSAIALPARGNRGSTAVVVQHLEDGVEDGHEVMFQLEAAKAQYRRFLETLSSGMPEVP